jgi:NAD(P)-dependent dehydrogenase (short-subunit alcohol dehydrogenase family)
MHRADALAESLLEQGITAMKIWPFDPAAIENHGLHISAEQMKRAVEPFEKIRKAVGDRIEIMVEFHSLWNLPTAKKIARVLEDYQPSWYEDPIRMNSPQVLADYAAATTVPVCASETLGSRYPYKDMLERDAMEIVMVDLCWTGGLTEGRKIAALAETYHRPFAPHDCIGPVGFIAGVHAAFSQPNTLIMESVRAFYRGWYNELVTTMPVIRDGFVYPMEGPGLGRAIAEGLGRAGASLIVNGASAASAEAAAAEMREAGLAAEALAFDVTDEAAIKAAFAALDARGVALDILVNNAGIQFRKPMVELETADWQRVIDTNLTSAFMIGREAARRMIPRGRGKIVNIGSLTSALARATVAPYTVAKGGIKMLTQAMAAEWAEHGLQANAIGPGYMLTDMNQALIANPDFDAWVKGRTPARRWGRPEELVGAAVFLASSASDYVNGQILYVDGGMLAVL